jgi:hypothetical protein
LAGVALFIKFEEAECETKVALGASAGAAAEAHVAGSGYMATAAALGPAMHALSTSTGLGFAHFGALAGIGMGQRVGIACKRPPIPALFANPHLITSAGNANSCSRPSVLKVAVVAAAADLLRFAGESVDGVMPLNGKDDPDRHLKAQGRRFARSFFGGGQGGVGG